MPDKIRIAQRSFARKALAQPEYRFENVYFLICREDWIYSALNYVLGTKGARTPGVDGITKHDLLSVKAQKGFVHMLKTELKERTYKPSPVRRTWIPKPGKAEKRPLGIPTIKDRVVQQLLRMLIVPYLNSSPTR